MECSKYSEDITHDGSMGRTLYLPTWMVEFMVNVEVNVSHMDIHGSHCHLFLFQKKITGWCKKNPHPVAHLLVVWWEKWPSIAQLPITKHSPDQKSTLLKTTVRWSTIAKDNKQNCRCISYWKKVDFPLLLWDYNKWNNSQYSYQIHPNTLDPKPWKMKVSNPKYMGHITPKNWRKRGFPWCSRMPPTPHFSWGNDGRKLP